MTFVSPGLPAAAGEREALLICPCRAMAAELSGLLAREDYAAALIDWKAYPPLGALEEMLAKRPAALCFLDASTDPDQAQRVLARLCEHAARPVVIVLLADNHPERALRCLRTGAAGFLMRPFQPDQLHAALERIRDHLPGAGSETVRNGKVSMVVPAKGSCGATTIASNLAWQSKQLAAGTVLLADTDVLTSTLAFQLKLQPQHSFVDALAHTGQLDADLWKAIVTPYRGLDVLTSPDDPLHPETDSADVARLLDYCRRAYDLVYLDAGSAYGAWNIKLARQSDYVLLVVTAEAPALYSAQRALDYLSRGGVDSSRVRLLVNRHRRDVGLCASDIEQALGMEVYQFLPSDCDATESALMEGRPVSPGSSLGKSLSELAARLNERATPAARPAQPGAFLSLFTRS